MVHVSRRSGRGSPASAQSLCDELYPSGVALKPSAVAVAIALLGVHSVSDVAAGPTGGQVTAGAATINQSGATTVINQSTPRAALNWQSFSIGSAESVIFQQPSSSAVALNRVVGPNPSAIYGTLQANGHVFLINPSGVLFGRGANVDVAGLVASTLNISNQDFMSGRYVFSGGAGSGAVVNHGSIRAANGGYVALLGNQVTNTGTIVASNGSVALGAGESMLLDFNGDGLLNLKVNAAAANAKIDHSGQIHADGGVVTMSAQAKNALLSTVLNVEGIVTARGIVERDGHIYLDGGRSGVTSVSGTLDASSAQARGGDMKVLGEYVGLFGNAKLDASGNIGGGTVLVGGDFQGKNPDVPNAQRTYVGPNATIKADAINQGDGGKVIVWADDVTRFHGGISVRGGAQSGDGGFVEVSGKNQLVFRGNVDAGAPGGKAGTLLLDPAVLIINGGASIDDGTDATDGTLAGPPLADDTPNQALFAENPGGTTTVTEARLEALDANIVLEATREISTGTIAFSDGKLTIAVNRDLTLRTRNRSADGDGAGPGTPRIDLTKGGTNAPEIVMQGTGALSITSGYGDGTNNGDLAAPVTLGVITTAGGSVGVRSSASSVTLNGALKSSGGSVTLTGTSVNSGAAGTITTSAPADSGAVSGAVSITATAGAIDLNGEITTSGASNPSGPGGDAGAITLNALEIIVKANLNARGGDAGGLGDDNGGAGGNITLQGPVTLSGSSTIRVFDTSGGARANEGSGGAGGNVRFAGTLDADVAFDRHLTISAGSGNVIFEGVVGGVLPLGDLLITRAFHVAGSDDSATPAQAITAKSFKQDFGIGNTHLSTLTTVGNASAAGGLVDINTFGNITVTGTIDTSGGSANGGAGRAGGNVSLTGSAISVGAITTSGSDAAMGAGGTAGSIRISAADELLNVTLNGDLTTRGGNAVGSGAGGAAGLIALNQPVLLAADVTVDMLAGNGAGGGTDGASANITFGRTVDSNSSGPWALTVGTSGTTPGITLFDFAVGSQSPLASVTINGGGETQFNRGGVATTGAQSYSGPVTLLDDTTFMGTIATFVTTITGNGKDLTFGFSDTTAIDANTFSGVRNFTTNNGGTTTVTGTITTSGTQTYTDAVTLLSNTTLEATAGGITFGGGVNGAFDLTANAGGAINVSGAAITTPGKIVTLTAGDTITVDAAISTRGADAVGGGSTGGAGGEIFLHHTTAVPDKPIVLNAALDASGGNAIDAMDTSGAGGIVTVYNASGNIAINSNIFAREGMPFGGGASGDGGGIQLKTGTLGNTIMQAATGSRLATTRLVFVPMVARLLVDSAGDVLLRGDGTNYVGTIAGRTRDPGASFSYRDGWPLIIDTVAPSGTAVAAAGLTTLSGIATANADTSATPGTPATTGSITLETVGGTITINELVRTGDATALTGNVLAQSGGITVTAGGNGDILSAGGDLQTGDATVMGGMAGDSATVGHITLSANRVTGPLAKPPASKPLVVLPGRPNVGTGTATEGLLNVTTDGTGDNGIINIGSTAPLRTGTVSALGAGAPIMIGARLGGTLTIAGPMSTANTDTDGIASGAIDLRSSGNIVVSSTVTTGSSTVANSAGTNSAQSGAITVTASSGLVGGRHLATGNATVTNGGAEDFAQAGNITISALFVRREGATLDPFALRLGTANAGAGTNLLGQLQLTTTGVGSANDSYITSDRALFIGSAAATGEGAALDFSTSGSSPLIVAGAITTADSSSGDTGSIALRTANATIVIGSPVTTGSATLNGIDRDARTGSITVTAGGTSSIATTADGISYIGVAGSLTTGEASVTDIGSSGSSRTARSGDITLLAGGPIIVLPLTLTTGGASGSDNGVAADVVSATSGSISVTATGANLMLGALTTGSATVTNEGPATATSGSIILSGGSIGTSAAARQLVSIGGVTTNPSGSDPGTAVNGVLNTTTTAGDTFVTSDVPIVTGMLVAMGAGKAIDIETTGSNPLTFGGTVATNNGNLVLSSSGVLFVDSAIAGTGTGAVNLTGPDGIQLNANVTTGGGAIVFNNEVFLGGNRTIGAGSGAITFMAPVDSQFGSSFSLTASSTGDTTFAGAVGSNQPLSALTTNMGGRTLIGGGSVATDGAQIYNDDVRVTANASFGAGGNLTFASKLDGAFDLTLFASGTTTLGGAVGGIAPLGSLTTITNQAGSGVQINGGLVATTGNQTYGDPMFSAPQDVTLGAPAELRSASGTLAFSGLVSAGANALTLTANDIAFNAGVDSVSGTGGITLQPPSDTVAVTLGNDGVNSTATFAGAPINLDALQQGFSMITIGRATSTAPTTVASEVIFLDPVTIRGGGITVNAALENFGDGASVTLTPTPTMAPAPGFRITLNDSIFTNNGPIALNAPVTVGGSPFFSASVQSAGCGCLFDAGADITFASTIDADAPGRILQVVAGGQGVVRFGGNIGAATPLAGLFVQAGAIRFNAPTGPQVLDVSNPTMGLGAFFFGRVVLEQNLRIEAGVNSVSFFDAVDGPGSLIANTSGEFSNTIFSGPVGGTTPLASLTTSAGAETFIDGGSVTTTGAQSYGGSVTLGDHTTLTGTNVSFGGEVAGFLFGGDDPVDLTLSFTGNTAITGTTLSNIRNFTSNNGGETTLTGTITTIGTQTYGDPVRLLGGTTLASSGGGGITFNSALDGAQTLAVNTAGATTFGGSVGGMTPLASIVTNAPGTTLFNGGTVTTTGAQTYGDPATLGAATTFTSTNGGAIGFNGTLNGAQALTVRTSGTTTFGGIVGGEMPLASIFTDAPGTTAINTTAINTTGNQTYAGPVTIGANATLNSSAGNISFGGDLDADAAAAMRTLAISAPTGEVTFSGNTGANQPFFGFNVTAGPNTIIFNAATGQTFNVNAGGGNTLTFTGNVLLNQSVTFNTDGAADNSIVFNSGINSGAGANRTLNIVAGSGNLTLGGVGGTGPLGGLNVAANRVTLNGNVALNGGGSLDFSNVTAVLLAPDVLIVMDAPGGSSNAGAINFNPATTIDAAGARSTLTLNPLADGGGADSAITLGTLGPNVTLVIIRRPVSPDIAFDSPLRSVLNELDDLEWMPEDADDDLGRRRSRRAVRSGPTAAGAPAACTASNPTSLSCD